MSFTPAQAHSLNIDAAQRDIDRRAAEGEDMTGATICSDTYKVIKPAPAAAVASQPAVDRLEIEIALESGSLADLVVLFEESGDFQIADAVLDTWADHFNSPVPERDAAVASITHYRANVLPVKVAGAALVADLRAEATRAKAGITAYAQADDTAYFAQKYLSDLSYEVRLRQLIERAIIRRAVTDILAVQADNGNGMRPAYTISVHDGEDIALRHSRDVAAIMGAIMSTDADSLIVRRAPTCEAPAPLEQRRPHMGEICLVYGNDGYDVMSDYSLSLESVLAGANALADAIGNVL